MVRTRLGRPRSFDKNAALDLAIPVFWRQGFQGAALSDLTTAMGINKPSLYAAFGNKESLYLHALERYVSQQMPARVAVLEKESDGRRAVEQFLCSMASMYSDPSLPGGCMIINGAAECRSPLTPASVDATLKSTFEYCESLLLKRMRRAQKEGQIPRSVRTQELAAYFSSILAGLSVRAKTGATRSKLNSIIATAMQTWPK